MSKKKSNVKKTQLKKRKKKSLHKKRKKFFLLDIFISSIISLALLFLIGSFFFSIEKVTSQSMKPLISKNERIILSTKRTEIKRFDIVGIKIGGKTNVLRVIGLPGETIKYQDDYLYVNDQEVTEKFIINQINEHSQNYRLFTKSNSGNDGFLVGPIPDDFFLVLGDNRPYATDSRQYGLVSLEKIVGKVEMKLSNFKSLK